jgi:hypothetical protein
MSVDLTISECSYIPWGSDGSSTNGTSLPIYDAACRALDEAKSVDELKDILDHAAAMQACARQARNKQMEADAAEIRERAERRLGEMIAAQREAGMLNPGTRLLGGGRGAGGFVADPPAHLPTLESLGIDKRLADKARKAFALPRETFEAAVAKRRGQILRNSRIKPLLVIAHRMQSEARRKATQAAALAAMPSRITDRYRLVCADMSKTDAVEPAFVDHIITDLPYPKEYLQFVEHLARLAPIWLKPGGSLVVMSGQCFLPEVFAALSRSGLMYRWTLCCEAKSGASPSIPERHIFPRWKPLLWYVKGSCDDLEWTSDLIASGERSDDKLFHKWGQSETQFEELVTRVSLPGQVILDPFCGGGTTGVAALRLGRQFIGIDIDEKAIATTAERLSKVECDAQHSGLFLCASNHLETHANRLSSKRNEENNGAQI